MVSITRKILIWYHKHFGNRLTDECSKIWLNPVQIFGTSNIQPYIKTRCLVLGYQNFDKKAKMKLNYFLVGSIAAMKTPTLITATGKTTLNGELSIPQMVFRRYWCFTRRMSPSRLRRCSKTVNDKRLAKKIPRKIQKYQKIHRAPFMRHLRTW